MIVGQSVKVRFNFEDDSPDFLAHGIVQDIREALVLVEFPPIDQSVILHHDDPREPSDAEEYALQCSVNSAFGKHWFSHSRIVETV